MTPMTVLTVLALVWLTATIVGWLVALTDSARKLLVVVLLVVYFVWVIGWPLLVIRG